MVLFRTCRTFFINICRKRTIWNWCGSYVRSVSSISSRHFYYQSRRCRKSCAKTLTTYRMCIWIWCLTHINGVWTIALIRTFFNSEITNSFFSMTIMIKRFLFLQAKYKRCRSYISNSSNYPIRIISSLNLSKYCRIC